MYHAHRLHNQQSISHACSHPTPISHQQVVLVLHVLAFHLSITALASSSVLRNKNGSKAGKQAYQRDAGI
jgi:hypothetical protein